MDTITDALLSQLNQQLDSSEQLPPFQLDGNFYHFKHGRKEPSSSHVWVIGWTTEFKGNTYQWVKCGDWRSGDSFIVKSYEQQNETSATKTHIKKHIEKIEKKASDEKEQRHIECAIKWKEIFDKAPEKSKRHSYVSYKKLKENYCARIRSGNNTLLVPIEHPEHGFVGCQQIWEQDGKYNKFFTKGIRITGSYSRLTDFDITKTQLVYVAEGYATAASVYMATQKPCIVCFNCNNLIPVIRSLRSINKYLKIIIAADEDHEVLKPRNPGRYKAQKATREFSNVIAKFPVFEAPEGLSDFNDLHVTEGIEKLESLLKYDPSDFVQIRCLGHKAGKYYYINTQTNEIFNLTSANHSPNNLLSQAKRKYWGGRFGFRKKDGEDTVTPDWDAVSEGLFDEQRSVGFFDIDHVRGVGAWIDEDKFIYNTGKNLIHDKEKENISEHSLQTKYVYEAKKEVKLNPSDELGIDECHKIAECFSYLNFKNPADYIYLCGWIVLAQIPGALDWRPGCWLTAARGVGKSTVLQMVKDLCYNGGNEIFQDPTAAGIRQALKNDALPVFIDEAEPNTKEDRKRNAQVLTLIRQSSSRIQSKIVRGTASGDSDSYLINSIFMLSSIQPSISNAADVSRFIILEMQKNSTDNFKKMKDISHHFIKWQKMLLALCINNIGVIRKAQKDIHHHLMNYYQGVDSRQADQLSHVLAGYWFLKYRQESVDETRLSSIFLKLKIDQSEYVIDNQSTDEEECLQTILSSIGPDRTSISRMITKNKDHQDLEFFGIKVLEQHKNVYDVFFTAKNRNLIATLSTTEFQDYAKVLRRLPNIVSAQKSKRVNGSVVKGFVLRIELSDVEAIQETDQTAFDVEETPF